MKTKFAFVTIALIVSAPAFAGSLSKLVCTSKDGSVVTWNQKFGELNLLDAGGEAVDSQDALILGEAKYYETEPAKTVTPILYGDEEPAQTYAEIIEMGGKISIEMDAVTYSCK